MLFGDLDLMVVIHFDLYKNKRRVQIAKITKFALLPVQNKKKILNWMLAWPSGSTPRDATWEIRLMQCPSFSGFQPDFSVFLQLLCPALPSKSTPNDVYKLPQKNLHNLPSLRFSSRLRSRTQACFDHLVLVWNENCPNQQRTWRTMI